MRRPICVHFLSYTNRVGFKKSIKEKGSIMSVATTEETTNNKMAKISKLLITSTPKLNQRVKLFYLETIYGILHKTKFSKETIAILKKAKIANVTAYDVTPDSCKQIGCNPIEVDYLVLPNSLYYWGFVNRCGVKLDFKNDEEEQRVKEAIYASEYITHYICFGVNYKIEYFVNNVSKFTSSLELSKLDIAPKKYINLREEQYSILSYFKEKIDPTELSNTDEVRYIRNGVIKTIPSTYDKWRLIIKALS